jgi:hypothetical protein
VSLPDLDLWACQAVLASFLTRIETGRCYPPDTLRHIARFCDRNSLHLISDEVYASCVFDSGDPNAVPFTSILSLDLQGLIDPNLVHVLYGFSKVSRPGDQEICFQQPNVMSYKGLRLGWPASGLLDNCKPATTSSMQNGLVSICSQRLHKTPSV